MSEQFTAAFWEIMNNILPSVITLLVGLLGVLATYLTTKLSKYLETKSSASEAEKKNKAVKTALDRFTSLVNTVVSATNQTVVGPLKEAAADGKLTKEEQKAVFTKAKEQIMSQLTVEMQTVLAETYADVDAYIENLIEESVGNLKTGLLKEVIVEE